MYAASFVVFVVVDILGPSFAPHLNDGALSGSFELGKHERGLVALLVHEGEVAEGEAILGEELQLSSVVLVTGVLQKREISM